MGSPLWLAVVLSLMAVGGHTLPPDDADCVSVAYYLCRDEDMKNASKDLGLDQSRGRKDVEVDCDSYLDVCCKSAMPIREARMISETTTDISHHTRNSSASLPSNSSGINAFTGTIPTGIPENSPLPTDCKCVFVGHCADEIDSSIVDMTFPLDNECENPTEKCCTLVKPMPHLNTTVPHTQPSRNSCGHRYVSSIRNGVSDSEAGFGEFPWMMALLQRDSEGKEVYLCGGSLIHPRVVLTGAHCVHSKKNLLIRAGEWDTQTDLEVYPTQDRNVSDVIIHEQSVQETLVNDMALLILENPVDIKEDEGHVGLVCLPKENEDFTGRDCVASGWGKNILGNDSTILKKVDLPVVPRDACQEALRKTKLGSYFKLHSSFICAGGIPGKDTCKGDGGSPLMCPSKADPDVYVQAGIVAWGISCGTETPATYVNVPIFVPWIHSQLQKHGISLTS